ncbi:L-aspartate oxidase, chloroplastic isoform X1 [Lolium perenne]|uniref:L-aspartate oxidase, chloroplastic isoform X1 n=1 Tax=Lolium perenne TaxID=4522 RepID=UPI0021F51131|nr:L-aspartate oxidase, chloroplastic isoform X1 [Lolium perenne]
MAKLMGGAAGFQQGAMHAQRARMQPSGLPPLSFRTCAQLEISRFCSIPRFVGAKAVSVPQQQHARHRVGSIRASALSRLQDDTTRYFDFVVIGSGVAGLRYALEVSKHGSVAIITKAEPHESNTNYAQGGVSAVLCPSDSVESHMQDTIVAGAYLCDEETVRVSPASVMSAVIVCTEGPERVKELIAMGASFDHGEDGRLHLAREGGHSHNRIVHSADMTGREIERALLQAVENDENISLFGHHYAIDLLTCQNNGEIYCYGVDSLDTKAQKVVRFISKVTLLASGGAGHIYPTTTNPPVATGDGIAMCHRAQAVISNMEFVQFHPTALADEGLPVKPAKTRDNAFLVTEAVRGDGGILYNQSMERFMPLYDDRAELAPRDVVARSIDDQLKKRGENYVLLDISHKPREKILAHFPNIAAECLRHGLDITRQPIPVVPAAHYMCGGVRAGLQGETSVKGLYVAGEVACTGLHGANRLASNSLLEALVFAQRAVQPSIDHMVDVDADPYLAAKWARPVLPISIRDSSLSDIIDRTRKTRMELQSIMWEYVGIVRSTNRLKNAEWKIGDLESEWEQFLFRRGWKPTTVGIEACEMRNLFCCAKLVVKSALARRESRGLHFTEDFPYLEESKRKPTVIFPTTIQELTWSSKPLQRQLQCK